MYIGVSIEATACAHSADTIQYDIFTFYLYLQDVITTQSN